MTEQWIEDDGSTIPVQSEPMVAPVPEPEETEEDRLNRITEVTDNDIMGGTDEDLSSITGVSKSDIMGSDNEDLDDIVDVSDADIMGYRPEPEPVPQYRAAPRARRVIRRYPPPPTIGGIR